MKRGKESASEKIKVKEMMEGKKEWRGMLAQSRVSEWLLFDKKMWNEFLNRLKGREGKRQRRSCSPSNLAKTETRRGFSAQKPS